MKKVYLKCGMNNNFGDDLFLKIISERYCNKFSIIVTEKKYIKNYNNVKFIYINSKIFRFFDKIGTLLKKRNFLETIFINKSDIILVVGGSIFMENIFTFNYLMKFYNKLENYYIIGCNIGPIYTKKYLNYVKNTVISNSKDVCFRDTKSYEMVSEVNQSRVATDIIFSLNVDKYINNYEKKVIFSIIDFDSKRKQIKNSIDKFNYENNIINIINYYYKNEYKISLSSFCEAEGDIIGINKILEKLSTEVRNCIEIYNYDGNIEYFLNYLSHSEVIVGTRFHANVVGFLLNKKVIPIVYNDKTEALLKDMNFKNYSFNINDKIDNIEIMLAKEYQFPNLKSMITNSKIQFKKIDEVLEVKND